MTAGTGDVVIGAARLRDGQMVDVTIAAGRIAEVTAHMPSRRADLDARGGLLLPGLHDHHVHIGATAAARASLRCGPPDVIDAAGLTRALRGVPGTGWLRGIGYHESVAGQLDRAFLDAVVPGRPVRIQHRSGRLWVFNSRGLDLLLADNDAPPALDLTTGWLFDADDWLREALPGTRPDLGEVSRQWSRWGVTGLTDMNPQNGLADAGHFAAQQKSGALAQRVVVAGRPELAELVPGPRLVPGPFKVHLHEAHLPEYEVLVEAVRAAHGAGRGVAIHCVTEPELVFALAALREAGPQRHDRIEHASVAPDALVAQIAQMGVAVVTQPNFVTERGEVYRSAIPSSEWDSLYRLRSFLAAGVTLAGGTDTPFGAADPWAAMAAAVSRRTMTGAVLGMAEALTPEAALDLFLADPVTLWLRREVVPGASADLCLMAQDWAALRQNLGGAKVMATLVGGEVVYQSGQTAGGSQAMEDEHD